jgi:predicted dehydrogenase
MRIAMEGATGRLGRTQHLIRSLLAIREEGGLALSNGDRLMPVPILLGRTPEKLAALAAAHGGLEWSSEIATVLADPTVAIYFDASATGGRARRAAMAIAAGKHIYLEKPVAASVDEAVGLARAAAAAGLKHGTVQDKLFLPGIAKLAGLRRANFFGEIFSVRLSFGWWVFDGAEVPAQRSSWNYKRAEGGGIIFDMFPHWRYILEAIVGPLRGVSCRFARRIRRRWDERGCPYDVDVEDEVFAMLEIAGGVITQISSSWATRVKRDELLRIQIDGAEGSAVAGLHRCHAQAKAATPKPVWNIELHEPATSAGQWQEIPDVEPYGNGYRRGWEMFLRHVAEGTAFPATLLEGAKGVQLAEACHRSDRERRWIDLPELSV